MVTEHEVYPLTGRAPTFGHSTGKKWVMLPGDVPDGVTGIGRSGPAVHPFSRITELMFGRERGALPLDAAGGPTGYQLFKAW